MERSEAIRFFEQSEAFIKMYLKEIKGDYNPFVFSTRTAIKNITDVKDCVNKVINYIRADKESADRLMSELIDLREMVKELRHETKKEGFVEFANVCNYINKRIYVLWTDRKSKVRSKRS